MSGYREDKVMLILFDEKNKELKVRLNDLEILIDMEDMKVFADDGNKEFPLGRIWTWGTGY